MGGGVDAKCQLCLMKPNCSSELLQQHWHPQEEPTGPGGRGLAEPALGCSWSNGAADLSVVILRNSLRMGIGPYCAEGLGTRSWAGTAEEHGQPLTIPGNVQNSWGCGT